MKIEKLDEGVITANVLIYGPSGVGKTWMMATAPKPLLVLDCEGGLMTARGFDDAKEIDRAQIGSYRDFQEVTKFLTKNPEAYKTVSVDSLTELQRHFGDEILGNRDKLKIQDYGTLKTMTERAIRFLRDLPAHFVATALEDPVLDDDGHIVTRRPLLVGKIRESIGQYFDVVGWLVAKEYQDKETGEKGLERRCVVETGPTWVAKDRSGALGTHCPPDLAYILEAIFEDKTDAPVGLEPKPNKRTKELFEKAGK